MTIDEFLNGGKKVGISAQEAFGSSGFEIEKPTSDVSSRISSSVQKAGEKVQQAISGEGEFAGRSAIRRGTEAVAEATKGVGDVVAQVLPESVRKVSEKVGGAAGSVFNFLVDKVSDVPALQKWVTDNPEAVKNLEEVLGTAAAAGTVAGGILSAEGVAKGAQKTVDLTKKGIEKTISTAGNILDNARPATKNLLERSKEIIKPTPTPEKALGEVLQAKKPITAKEMKAFSTIDTSEVKTFADLEKKMTKSIEYLSGQVDEHLATDPTPLKMEDLVTKTTTGSGKIVERNFVETALDNLRELYTKTADDVAAADIESLLGKAQAEGLTRLEVNDISRLYNSEFGSKAFSKFGDPLTSVNAQMYENIRKGLKDVARKGMGGTEAAATDKIISSLYNTRDLVKKNAQAVQVLQQRIAERGLFEKFGHIVAKYGDILTGGSIRGFIGGLLPRGAGYKVLNALDLEQRLAKNLEIIQKALKSSSDKSLIQGVESLNATLSK